MHNCYSNHAYMHSYCSSSIYYFINFFSLMSLVSLCFSHFLSLSLSLSLSLTSASFSFSLSLLIHSLLQPHICKLLSSNIFSTFVSSQPSGKRRTWRPLRQRQLQREPEEAPINHENKKQKKHKASKQIWVST